MNKQTLLFIGFFIALTAHSTFSLAHGEHTERIKSLSHDIHHQPNNTQLLIERGRVYLDEKRWQKALNDFTRALEINEQLDESWYWQAEVFRQQKNYTAAQQKLRVYLNKQPSSAKGAHKMAQIHGALGNIDLAKNYFDLAITNDSNPLPTLYVNRASFLHSSVYATDTAHWTEIQTGLEQGLKQHPRNIALVATWVELAQQTHHYLEALMALAHLPPLLNSSPRWLFKRAELHQQLSQNQLAIENYKKAIEAVDSLPHQRAELPKFKSVKDQARNQLQALSEI